MTVGELTDTLARLPRDLDVSLEIVRSDDSGVDFTCSSYARVVVAEAHVAPDLNDDGDGPVVIRGW